MYAILVVLYASTHQHIISSSHHQKQISISSMMMILIDWIDMTHNTQHHFLLLESYFVSFLSFFPQIIFFLSFFQFFHVSCLYESLSMSIANSIGTSYLIRVKILVKHLWRPCHHPCWPFWGAGQHEYSVRHHLGQW